MITRVSALFIIISFGCSTSNSFKVQDDTYARADNKGSMVNYNIPTADHKESTKIKNIILNKKEEISNRHTDRHRADISPINKNKSNEVITVLMTIIVYSFIFIWIYDKVRNKNKN